MMAVFGIAMLALACAVFILGFLLLGALRAQGLLIWRLDQLEATMPSRIGRSGLAPGKQAPDFRLTSVQGGDVSLSEFSGRKVLLVFVQSGCGPCHEIVPELNKLAAKVRDLQILAINHATPDAARAWAAENKANFPVVVQEDWSVSKRYEAFATPFAFLVDERGIVVSKGIVGQRHYLGYVLSTAVEQPPRKDDAPAAPVEHVASQVRLRSAATG